MEAINLWNEEVEKDQNKVKDGEDRDKNREGDKDRDERGKGGNKDGKIERAGICKSSAECCPVNPRCIAPGLWNRDATCY